MTFSGVKVLRWRPFTKFSNFSFDLCAHLQSFTSDFQCLPALPVIAVLTLLVAAPTAGVSSRTAPGKAHWAHSELIHILRPCLAASRLSAGRGKAASSVITPPLRAIFSWPETTHSFPGVLLMVHLLHYPWFTSVAQPSLLCEHILGRRIKKQKSFLGFVCFWYLDITLSQLAKSIKAYGNYGVLFKRIKHHRKVYLVGLYPSPAVRWVQKLCISGFFPVFGGKCSLYICLYSFSHWCCLVAEHIKYSLLCLNRLAYLCYWSVDLMTQRVIIRSKIWGCYKMNKYFYLVPVFFE